ncbi:MAG: hypothetical protein D3M94_06170 [Rhodocyclales bacterium GT-UBC]|nr:MAG: hypothetical protein D3M94_06170 [Rhodocyclales bacterium GT-UBC]
MLLPLLRLLLLYLLLLPAAQAGNVALVLSENSGPYNEFANNYREALDNGNWKISSQGGVDSLSQATPRPDLIIAVGSSALRQVLAQAGSIPVIATLVPRQTYEKLLAESGYRNRRITAIYLDQPPARQAAFLRALLPGKKRVGMLVSTETQGVIGQFRSALNNAGLTLDTEDSDTENTLLPALNTLLQRNNLLLAIPDTTIYRRENIKAILVTTYRHQKPVVAFSAAFVNSGALAALYSTPAQIARQAAEVTSSLGSTLPAPMSPTQFAVVINSNVAQALDLVIPDEASIRRAILNDKEAR